MEGRILVALTILLIALLSLVHGDVFDGVIVVDEKEFDCFNESCADFNPYSPLIKCEYLPEDFYNCMDPLEVIMLNISEDGCQFNQEKPKQDEIEMTLVNCTVLPGIECHGERVFQKRVPCVKYSGHHFVTILLFSVFLGFIGLDRFCLGHIPTAVGKLVTIGGLGVWWMIDIVLLVTGQLKPKDGSSWCP